MCQNVFGENLLICINFISPLMYNLHTYSGKFTLMLWMLKVAKIGKPGIAFNSI